MARLSITLVGTCAGLTSSSHASTYGHSTAVHAYERSANPWGNCPPGPNPFAFFLRVGLACMVDSPLPAPGWGGWVTLVLDFHFIDDVVEYDIVG